MGYSHYPNFEKPIKLSYQMKKLIEEVISDHAEDARFDFKPKSHISVGHKEHDADELHVVFDSPEYDFVKTNREDYDKAVSKVLAILTLDPNFTFTSDGLDYNMQTKKYEMDAEWKEALTWFVKKGNKSHLKVLLKPTLKKAITYSKNEKPSAVDELDKALKTINKGKAKLDRKRKVPKPTTNYRHTIKSAENTHDWEGYYEFHGESKTDKGSHKFYKAEALNGRVKVTWGRIGTSGKSMTYDWAKGVKTVLKKIANGYLRA